MINGSIPQEAVTILNTYAPNIAVPKYIKQVLLINLTREIDFNTIIVVNFNTPLSALDR
jgi:hypothetical protein